MSGAFKRPSKRPSCGESRRVVETRGPGETEALGGELAAALAPGDLVLISGELGAGKTTLVRGACRALGVTGPVTSPTFTIGSVHRGTHANISHLDLYRLAGLADEDPALLEDYLGADRIAFVEWPERDDGRLGQPCLAIHLEHAGGDRRRIEVLGRAGRTAGGTGG
jgi:tRNA threonylcarbamoyladenosine biosynthesis protein TsaE